MNDALLVISTFCRDFPQWKVSMPYENEILITNNYPNQSQTIYNPESPGHGLTDVGMQPHPLVFDPIRVESVLSSIYIDGVLTVQLTNGYTHVFYGSNNSINIIPSKML